MIHGKPHPFLEEAGHPDQEQRPEEQRVVAQPSARARPLLALAAVLPPVDEFRRPHLPAAPHHVENADDKPETGEVGDQAEGEIEGAMPEGEAEEGFRDVVLDRDDAGRGEQQEEAVHDRRVSVACGAVAPAHGPLGEDVEHHSPEAAPQMDRDRAPASTGVAEDVPGDTGRAHGHRTTRHHEEERVAEGGDLPEELAGLHRLTRPDKA